MTRQKNKILTFLFALIPGAGQMYLGFMKRGLSLTLYAVVIGCLALALYMPAVAILLPPVWLYAFFDALNLNGCDAEIFDAVEDEYVTFDFIPSPKSPLFESRNKRFWGRCMILVGILFFTYNMLLVVAQFAYSMDMDQLGWFINDILKYAPRFIIAVILIAMGKSLISGNKQKSNVNMQEISFAEFAEEKKDIRGDEIDAIIAEIEKETETFSEITEEEAVQGDYIVAEEELTTDEAEVEEDEHIQN